MIRTYFKNAGIVAISELILRLRSFLLIPLITRAFGPVDYGVWAQVSLIAVTLAPVLALGTNPAALRILPGLEFDDQRRKFSAWILFLFSVTALASIPIVAGRDVLARLFFGGGEEFARFIPLAILTVVAKLILDSFRTWYRVQKNAGAVSIFDISRAALNILAVLLMFIQKESVFQLVIYTIISDFIVLLIAIIVFAKNPGWKVPDFSILKPMLKFGSPLIPTGLAVWALNYSDRLLIVNFLDLSQLGIYSVAYSLGATVIELFAKPLRMMLHPTLAELYNLGNMRGLSRIFNYSVFSLSVLCIPSIVGLYVLGDPIIVEISTINFFGGGKIISIVALAAFLFKIAGNYGFIIGLVNKPHLQSISTVIAVGVNVSLNFLLIPRIGIMGAALATLSAFFVNYATSFYFAYREKLVQIDTQLLLRVTLSAILMGITLSLMLGAVPMLSGGGLFRLGLAISLAAIFYALFLFALGVINKDRFSLVRGILSGKIQ
jgi:O-antigen/teichoic acid export membrane protein